MCGLVHVVVMAVVCLETGAKNVFILIYDMHQVLLMF